MTLQELMKVFEVPYNQHELETRIKSKIRSAVKDVLERIDDCINITDEQRDAYLNTADQIRKDYEL